MASDNRRYGVFPQQPELALYQILQEAQHRWLRPTEVCEILHNYRKFKLTPDPPQKPQNGSLFLFDRKALRYFRKDGHNWRKKKDGKTVREAHERLKVGSIDVLHCYYAHGEDNETFQRRSYWLLEGAYEHIVLVHYREVKEGNRSGIMRSVNGYNTPEALKSPTCYTQAIAAPISSPQSSPFVSPHASPHASSPNSSEWNGNTFSPECDEPDSGDDDHCPPDLDLHPKQQGSFPKQFNGGFGAAIDSRSLQSRVSFSTKNSSGLVSEEQLNSSAYPLSGLKVRSPGLPDIALTQRLSLNQGNGHFMHKELSHTDSLFSRGPSLPPGGFDLLEWTEYMRCAKNSDVTKGYEEAGKEESSSPTWTEVLDHCSTVQQHNSLETVVSSSIGTPYKLTDSKAQICPQSQILSSMQPLMDAPFCGVLERELHAVSDRRQQHLVESQTLEATGEVSSSQQPVSSTAHWHFVFEQLGGNGQGQPKQFGAFEQEKSTLNLSQQPHFQFQQHQSGEQQHAVLLNEPGLGPSNITDMSLSHTYSHVFKDFQADNPAQHEENENFKKLDSFGRWMTQEIGGDGENSLLTVSSDSTTYWPNALDDQGAAEEVSSLSQHMQLNEGLSLPSSQEQCFSIVDFSPEYAISGGGTKVLVTGIFLKTVRDPSEYNWGCLFGEVEVTAELLQPGVFRCIAPPLAPGRVPFCVTRNDRVACSEVREFEYRAVSNALEILSPQAKGLKSEEQDDDTSLLQIRLARILSSGIKGTQMLHCHGLEEPSILRSKLNYLIGNDDIEWGEMENCLTGLGQMLRNVKEQLIEKLIKEKLQEWLICKAQDEGKGASVLGDHGLGVIHIGVALGYDWVIAPVLAAGVSINFRDARGWTALHWAAYYGRERTVVALLAAGAAPGAKTDPTPRFLAGQTPADLASSRGHKGIAGYLAESSLTSHLFALTLKESLTDNISAALAGEKAVETVSERSSIQHNPRGSEEQLSLQDSLAAVRNAAQAAARIRATFRIHSFKKKQQVHLPEKDEYGISEEQARSIIVAQRTHKSGRGYHEEVLHSAAIRIQQKFRGWKGRRDFLLFRQHVVKIQAHVRGHQVRKQYRKIVWTVGIVEKAILRWRRKGKGLRGFCAEVHLVNGAEKTQVDSDGDDDFLKVGRKQTEAGLEKALARVQSMVKSREAQDQYRRLLESFHKAKDEFNANADASSTPSARYEEDFLMSMTDQVNN